MVLGIINTLNDRVYNSRGVCLVKIRAVPSLGNADVACPPLISFPFTAENLKNNYSQRSPTQTSQKEERTILNTTTPIETVSFIRHNKSRSSVTIARLFFPYPINPEKFISSDTSPGKFQFNVKERCHPNSVNAAVKV